jgi:hypothetical protein
MKKAQQTTQTDKNIRTSKKKAQAITRLTLVEKVIHSVRRRGSQYSFRYWLGKFLGLFPYLPNKGVGLVEL